MHELISLCVTNNLHWNFEYFMISSLSEWCFCMQTIFRQIFICLGDFRKELHSTYTKLMSLGGLSSPLPKLEYTSYSRETWRGRIALIQLLFIHSF